jgi:hypothetical protein
MAAIKESLIVHSAALQKAMDISENANSRWADIMLAVVAGIFGLTALVIVGFIVKSIPSNDGKTIIIVSDVKEIENVRF